MPLPHIQYLVDITRDKGSIQMSNKVAEFLEFLQKCFHTYQQKKGRGRPLTYSHASMTVFFMVMALKKIHSFKGMTKYAKQHYAIFGFDKAPSRKTIRRRFLNLPVVIHWLLPQIVLACRQTDCDAFRCSSCFIDKSVFRALGGLWHKKHMLIGIVPHPSIDTDASWAKSAYHKWRFGYGLHLVCLQNRFPIAAWVTTASTKDYTIMSKLLTAFNGVVGVVVGDRGYQCLKVMKQMWQDFRIFVQTPALFETYLKTPFVIEYNQMIKTVQARLLYRHRKPAIEPLFSLIKEMFDLKGEKQLPYRGLPKVSSYLMLAPLTVQLMIRDNFLNRRDWASTEVFLSTFK
jgi:Transposase DDE domain